ncbi:tail fiber-like repeat protein [Anoxybacillus vitaminiphilus]|uniref:Tail fiber-like repeat protein n=1 Tax=Paranoxybacillus vitaminiphilus TaxID=581036 RepID=A0A327YN84_9BACL|nr:tail fiber protein [Anoxybacillus vitaminiphilus]RAK21155.1 tail fiber-like repeat protein [Anoxybacillus vitaminiphilus]
MQLTGNLGLKKPEGTDVVNIDDLNQNFDILDVEVVKVASPTQNGRMSAADKAKLDGIEAGAQRNTITSVNGKIGAVSLSAADVGASPTGHTHTFAEITSKPTTLSGYGITDAIPASQKGAANGVATLDGSTKVPVSQLPTASTSAAGIVQLDDSVSSTSTTKSATANAVKQVNDALAAHSADTAAHGIGDKSALLTNNKSTLVAAINELFTSVSNGKNQIAAAITDKGVSASGSDTFGSLASKIQSITSIPNEFKTGAFKTNWICSNIYTVFADSSYDISELYISPNKRYILMVGKDIGGDSFRAVIYDTVLQDIVSTLSTTLTDLCDYGTGIADDGTWIIAYSNKVRIYSLDGTYAEISMSPTAYDIRSASLSPNGQYIAIISERVYLSGTINPYKYYVALFKRSSGKNYYQMASYTSEWPTAIYSAGSICVNNSGRLYFSVDYYMNTMSNTGSVSSGIIDNSFNTAQSFKADLNTDRVFLIGRNGTKKIGGLSTSSYTISWEYAFSTNDTVCGLTVDGDYVYVAVYNTTKRIMKFNKSTGTLVETIVFDDTSVIPIYYAQHVENGLFMIMSNESPDYGRAQLAQKL